MDYKEMIEKLDAADVDVTYYGKSDERWNYAVVINSYELSQDDFPANRTCSAEPNADFIVSLLRDFEGEDDVASVQEYCGVYNNPIPSREGVK